ncbi:hypothetical protein [Sediminibacillus massiliensis]|uniref:hypothetical protein n=1 Tax=Sediminibacillus massiliensis TaxID=1926277 RepID=UPI0009886416|nr:hypothetical protein [Sediminibacillus massiliensis]
MTELQDFLYELNRYMNQTSVLQDSYKRLSENEKQLVLAQSPNGSSPDALYNQSISWLNSLQEEMGIKDEEPY